MVIAIVLMMFCIFAFYQVACIAFIMLGLLVFQLLAKTESFLLCLWRRSDRVATGWSKTFGKRLSRR